MKKTHNVSIIILNWNGYKDTIECLKSLSKIKWENYKVYLVDNGSTDGSIKKIKIANKILNLPIEYIQNKTNYGFAKGNNIGIRRAIKDKYVKYFLLLNNDTIVDKRFLTNLISETEKDKKIGVVSPLVFNYYYNNKVSINDSPGKFNLKNGGGEPWFKDLKELSKKRTPFYVDYTCGSCWLVRRDVLEKTGFFNEEFFAYSEEIDLAIRMQKEGYKFLLNPISKIWHKGAVSSNKITGFKTYYSTRNIIWIERIYASDIEFLVFIFNFLALKFPKNIFKILTHKNKITNIKNLFSGIVDGFFSSKRIFNSSKNYKS